ncbi:hypothetical protein WICPIJ_009864 [Wickerhamomyces pijperi]|uniref:Mitochondrial import inner membrane translocase subunit n=1 Tax=Wickerhamomyces pijperi TaxID=599730 RepID=A0A9P8PKI7_WICPI|nr:hypothetical protein WICPIJ_009864 [Wickerhamomyces pijperi]
MAFGLFGSSTGAAAPITSAPVDKSSQVKEELKAQIAQELAVANATELVNKITSNCFEKCMSAPYSYKDEVS